jgi:drug/metabolite transporter (DMT)-like permease
MWIIFALGASITWGLTYVVNEQVYKKISVITSLAITMLISSIVMFIVAIVTGVLKKDINAILGSQKLFYLILIQTAILIIAELFIGFSITGKNATLAGLIEISYPIFIAIFAYFLYKENQINFGTLIGGLLIFTGIAVVYYFNR